MEKIERYLEAVRGQLPAGQAADIIAELRDSLLSGVEERESELGRPLDAAELDALLKRSGHPVLVAARYLPQQHLIGPGLFPYWLTGMRALLIGVGVIYVVVGGVDLVAGDPIQAALRAGAGFLDTGLTWAALFTAVLAVMERCQHRPTFLDRWDPARLPPVSDRLRVKRVDALVEAVFAGLFIGWWLGWLDFPAVSAAGSGTVSLALSDSWSPYRLPILAVAVCEFGLAVVNLASPRWRWDRLLLRVMLSVATLAIVSQLFQADVLVTAVADPFPRFEQLTNQGTRVVLAGIAIASVFELVQGLRRLAWTARAPSAR